MLTSKIGVVLLKNTMYSFQKKNKHLSHFFIPYRIKTIPEPLTTIQSVRIN